MLDSILNLLINHPLIGIFGSNQINGFIDSNELTIHNYQKNNIIHHDGDLCDSLEIILKGNIAIERIDSYGNLLVITKLLEGDIYGGHLMFSSNPKYLMTIMAKSDSILLEIKKDILLRLLSSNPTFLIAYLEYIAELTAILGNKIKYSIKTSIRESLLEYIRQQIGQQSTSTIKLKLTKKELAENMGIQRTSLSRELTKMKDDGLITYTNKTITLL